MERPAPGNEQSRHFGGCQRTVATRSALCPSVLSCCCCCCLGFSCRLLWSAHPSRMCTAEPVEVQCHSRQGGTLLGQAAAMWECMVWDRKPTVRLCCLWQTARGTVEEMEVDMELDEEEMMEVDEEDLVEEMEVDEEDDTEEMEVDEEDNIEEMEVDEEDNIADMEVDEKDEEEPMVLG